MRTVRVPECYDGWADGMAPAVDLGTDQPCRPYRMNPSLPAGSPFDLGGRAFLWSATRRALFTDLAWGVNIRDGGFVDDYEFFLQASAWCVRGGTNAEEH